MQKDGKSLSHTTIHCIYLIKIKNYCIPKKVKVIVQLKCIKAQNSTLKGYKTNPHHNQDVFFKGPMIQTFLMPPFQLCYLLRKATIPSRFHPNNWSDPTHKPCGLLHFRILPYSKLQSPPLTLSTLNLKRSYKDPVNRYPSHQPFTKSKRGHSHSHPHLSSKIRE